MKFESSMLLLAVAHFLRSLYNNISTFYITILTFFFENSKILILRRRYLMAFFEDTPDHFVSTVARQFSMPAMHYHNSYELYYLEAGSREYFVEDI